MSVMLAPLGVNARDGRTAGVHRMFALHYAQFMNSRQAAIHCGYPPDKAGQAGSRLLKNKKVIAELAKLNVKTQGERVADIQEQREFWTAVMRGEREDIPEALLQDKEGNPLPPREQALARWQYQHDMGDRIKCSELLGKSMGAFIERNESKVTVRLVIEDESANLPPIEVTPTRLALTDE